MRHFLATALFLLTSTFSFAQVSITSAEAKGHIGHIVSICDKIVDSRFLENSVTKPTLLNVGGAFPNHLLTIVINFENRPNFGFKPEEFYLGKQVCVTGKVVDFKGTPQIVVLSPAEMILNEGGAQASTNPSTNTSASTPAKAVSTTPAAAPVAKNNVVTGGSPATNKVVTGTSPTTVPTSTIAKTETPISKVPPATKAVSKPAGDVTKLKVDTAASSEVYDIKLTSDVNIRSGPGPEFEVVEIVKSGTVVTILKSENGWSYLSYRRYSKEQLQPLIFKGFAKNSALK